MNFAKERAKINIEIVIKKYVPNIYIGYIIYEGDPQTVETLFNVVSVEAM